MENYYGNCDTVRSEYSLLYYNSDDAICFGFFPTSIYGNYKFKKKPLSQSNVQSSQFDEWFNTTLGDHFAKVIYKKIEVGDFANDSESGY